MESQTPPRPPQKQEPPKSETVWISPRLREKLGDGGGDAPRQGGGSPLVGIVLALLVASGGIGLFMAMRSGAAREKAAAEHQAHLAAQAAAAESVANAARMDSMRVARAADSTAHPATYKHAAAPPAPTAAARPVGGTHGASASSGVATAAAEPAPPAAPVEHGPFGLDVGSFLVEDRANSEQSRLSASTGLAGKVMTKSEDGADVYHVVLGSFPSRAAAERKAGTLVAKGLVNQARTVPLSP